MKKTISIIVASGLFLSACNTIQGVGEDLSAAGKGVANTAEKTKEKISK
jgi:predicted small secreted protein